MIRQIKLNDSNASKAEELSRKTGRTPEQLVNEAFEHFRADDSEDEHQQFLAWQDAARRFAGIWKDRDDLPDFRELRASWDRGMTNRD
jgi:predicted DNA-binding protein